MFIILSFGIIDSTSAILDILLSISGIFGNNVTFISSIFKSSIILLFWLEVAVSFSIELISLVSSFNLLTFTSFFEVVASIYY